MSRRRRRRLVKPQGNVMDVVYTLIPGMIVLGLVLVGILIWAVKHGQYEDLEGDANRILLDEDEEMMPGEKPARRPAKPRPDLNGPDAED